MPRTSEFPPDSSFRLAGIILAAGEGARFDPFRKKYKLAQRLPCGKSVLEASCLAMLPHVGRLIVVTGQREGELEHVLPSLPSGVQRVHCPDAHLGMGASVKAALRAAQDADGWLLGLADMPWIASSTIGQVAEKLHSGAAFARPFHRGQPGHPVGLSAIFRAELLALPDEHGAQRMLRRHAERMVRLDVDDAGCIADIDYPEDLLRVAQ